MNPPLLCIVNEAVLHYIHVCTDDILVMGLEWTTEESDLWSYFGQFGQLEMAEVCELIAFAPANL